MKYKKITKNDMNNGDGLRVVLWLCGCSHHCEGCQNPSTWDPEDGNPFTEEVKTVLFEELQHSYTAGITLTGGDPLFKGNIQEVTSLCREIKEKFPQKTIWCYTGDKWNDILSFPIVQYLDVVVDGEFILEKRDVTLLWKGSSNQRVIDVKATLLSQNKNEPVLHCQDYEN